MRWVVVLLLLPGVPAGAQIVVNGSFEAPALGAAMGITGAFSFSGWSGAMPANGGNGGLVVGVDNGLAPADGRQHFTFNGGNPSDRGYIEQAIATTAGVQYSLSFQVGRAGGGQELALQADALGGGVSLASGVFSPPGSRTYSSIVMSFVATGGSTLLRFSDVGGGNSISDLYLDNVSVTAMSAVPEPGAWAAIAGAVVLGGAVVRRRSRRWWPVASWRG